MNKRFTMKKASHKLLFSRLSLMNFLQFGIWGAYLISLGNFLHLRGFDTKIWIFFSMQGVVSLFMPALAGIIADRKIPAQKMLSLCHGIAAIAMLGAGIYAKNSGDGMQFWPFFILYSISIGFYMPTLALNYSVSYNAIEKAGEDPVSFFPPIRMFGTVGFVVCMLFVNFMRDAQGLQYQQSHAQFLVSGMLGLFQCAYALTMPACPVKSSSDQKLSFFEASGLSAFSLFKQKSFALFFIFCVLLGSVLQITNGYANTFISSFKDIPAYSDSWGARNANALVSISQISETICLLLIPFFLKKYGIKMVMAIAMFAWMFRFGLFGFGNPGSGVWMLILSCIIYGVAFDFFNISGSLFVNQNAPKSMRASAQGLFMLMTNGLGATIGTWLAGKVVNHFVYQAAVPDWRTTWLIFAGYALFIAILFIILFKNPAKKA